MFKLAVRNITRKTTFLCTKSTCLSNFLIVSLQPFISVSMCYFLHEIGHTGLWISYAGFWPVQIMYSSAPTSSE